MKIALLPGSYDPMTLGHKRIVERALKNFDKVVVGVMVNKEKTYMFSMDERLGIARATVADMQNVDVIADAGYTVDLAEKIGATALVKGIRNEEDFNYELEGELFNRERAPQIETYYLRSEPEYSEISSTLARELIMTDGKLKDILAPEAIEYIRTMVK